MRRSCGGHVVVVTNENGTEFRFCATRDMVCKKVHIGTKVIPAQPEQVIDEYDWQCEKVSFLGVDIDG